MYKIVWNSRAALCALTVICAGLMLAACGLTDGHGSVASGTQYQAQGKYRAASIEAKKVLQREPNNGDAWLLLGKATLMLGDPKNALSDFDKARANGVSAEQLAVPTGQALRVSHQFEKLLKDQPASDSFKPDVRAQLASLRGDAWRGLNKPSSAEKAYKDSLKLNPDNPRALTGLARLAAAAHDSGAANKYVQQALAAASDSPEAWIGKADLAFRNDELASAASAYQKALGIHASHWLPQDRFMARLKLTSVQVQRKQFDKALANIQTLEKMSPQQPQPHYLHAVVLYRQGHLDDAVAQLQKVLKASPENIPAQLLMGTINYAQGNYGQTEMYLSNVMGMDRNNVSARKLLALTYYREGRSAQALDTLRPIAPETIPDGALLARLHRAAARDNGAPSSASIAGAGSAPTMASLANITGRPHDTQFADVRRALAGGHITQAIHMLKTMPKGDASTEAKRTTLLVMADVYGKRVDAAVKTAAANAAANPHDSAAQLLYGTALVADHQYDKARTQYQKAHKLDHGNIAALINLGSLDVHEQHYKEAEKYFEEVLQTDPHNTAALSALGKLAVVQYDRANAIKWFKQLIAAAPKSAEGYTRLIMLYSRSGQFDQAVSTAKELADAAPNNPVALNALGAAELNANHPDKALKPLQQAVKIAPDDTLYRINLARAQISLKDNKAAEANLEKMDKTGPMGVQAVRLLATIKMRDHDLPAAIALAQTLQKKPDTKAAGFTLQGDLYMANKSYDKAAKAYQDGLKVHDDRSLVVKHFLALRAAGAKAPEKGLRDWLDKHASDDAMRMLLAQYYMNSSQHALAERQYVRVLKAYPSNLAALNNLAWLYVGQHKSQGLALAKRAYKLSPDSPSIADTYGWALIEFNQPRDALPILEKAAKAAPKVPTIRYHLAVAQSQSGNHDGARATLDALKKMDVGYPEQLAAEKLYRKLGSATVGRAVR